MRLLLSLLGLGSAQNFTEPDTIDPYEGGDWPGQAADGTLIHRCGTHKMFNEDFPLNKTCTLDFGGFNPNFVQLGAGAFSIITSGADYEFTGRDGWAESGVEVTIFWEEFVDGDGLIDNSTCGSFESTTIDCVDENPNEENKIFILSKTAHNEQFYKAGEEMSKSMVLLIPAYNVHKTVTVAFMDADGAPTTVSNITGPDWAIPQTAADEYGNYAGSEHIFKVAETVPYGPLEAAFSFFTGGAHEVMNIWRTTVN